ncbi:MAG: YebC/PmpR family DNA-binding transcriptional regulator [Candidatus Paceibacterota bacterium]|jgi:YebC/PmpR family DNA-binding regulatory protein
MSGHNKWSQIKHKKGAEDAKKSKAFSALVKMITIESRSCGGNKNSPGLKTAIEKAKASNMPADNIERAIKKGVGLGAGSMEEVVCEAYGPGGVGIIIEATTDNKNRTVPEIRHILDKNGANMGAQGSVAWAFQKSNEGWTPTTVIPLSEEDRNKLESILEALSDYEEIEEVYTNAEQVEQTA